MRFPGSEARHARHIGLFGIEMISRLDFFLSLRTGHDRKSMCNKLEMTSFQNNFIHVSLSRGSIFDQDSGCDGLISRISTKNFPDFPFRFSLSTPYLPPIHQQTKITPMLLLFLPTLAAISSSFIFDFFRHLLCRGTDLLPIKL